MKASSQKVNESKLEIYFINTNSKVEDQIYHIIGYNKGSFPCKYLGIKLEKGVKLGKVWNNILEKLEARIGCWKDKWLTKARKSIMISLI